MVVKHIFAVIIISIIVNINVIHCVTCTFSVTNNSTSYFEYECLLLNQNIHSDDDMMIINGTHENGFSNENVTYIRAENSSISVFPSLVVDQFRNLNFVDLSGVNMKFFVRPITNCNSLLIVYLRRNEFTTFSGGIFKNCGSLRHIHMEDNTIRFLDSEAFAGTNITELHLQNNDIEFLQPATFAHIPYLQALFLSNNSIQEILPGTFNSTQDLFFIGLDRNKLTSWNAINTPVMYSLDLSRNQISTISSDAFADMSNMLLLDLSNNYIVDVPTFQGLGRLSWLNLMLNKIKHVNAESFTNLTNLQYLYLDHNEIESFNFTIGDDNFLPNMQTLAFNSNQLLSISGLVLPVNVTSVDFSFNKLTHLETGSIQPISQLHTLNLENNEIRKIDRDFFNDANHLTVQMKNNHCYSETIMIIDRDDLEKKEAILENCYNHGTNSIPSVIILVISAFISINLKF